MKKGLFILLIFCFSLTVSSCSDDKDESSENSGTTTITDSTSPTVLSTSASDSDTRVSVTLSISVTFSEAMDTTSLTTNTSNTTCSGSLQLSSDNFSSCVQMGSSPSSSNSDKTFSVTPYSSLSNLTTYKIRITTGVKDISGNALANQWTTSNGFTTISWTLQFGTSKSDFMGWDNSHGVSIDSSGNIYVGGTTADTTSYCGGGDDGDLIVYSFNNIGSQQWSQKVSSTLASSGSCANDYVYGLATDSSGNVFAVGKTDGVWDGSKNNGVWDFFIVKFNSTGTKQWSKQIVTASTIEYANDVAADSSGNVYVTGQTSGGLDSNTSAGGYDIFLVKYNSSGTKQWTKQFGTSSADHGYAVDIDSSDNIYVTGATAGGLDNNSSAGSYDIFLTKFYDNGTKQWTKQFGTSSADHGYAVDIDSSDNITVTGRTEGGLDGSNVGSIDFFVVKYNSSGTKLWTKQLGTSSSEYGQGVSSDSSGNIFVTGYTGGGLDGNTNSGSNDIFLVKYNSSGTKQWTKQLGTSSDDRAYGVTTDSAGNAYITGFTGGELDGNTSLGSNDFFLLKYNSSGVLQ